MNKAILKCIVSSLTISFIALLILSCSCNLFDTHQEAIEYLIQFEDNDDIVYVDNGTIYFGERKIDFNDKKVDGYDVRDILYVSREYIYFYTQAKKVKNIYVCDHNFESISKISSIEDAENVTMESENEIRFSKKDVKYIFLIDENRTVRADEFPNTKSEYDFRIVDKAGDKNDKIEITKNQTGEKKTVNLSEILKIEQANRIKDITGYFDIAFVSQKNEMLYISCVSNFIVTTFSFDFKSETIKFADWSEAYGNVSVFII